MPKISIIVPVYNVQKYIRECLESLVNQTFNDIEIIIIDDGSPDESYKIYSEYASRDKRIKVIKKKNAGVSEARNTGISAAVGDYLMFVDSDDWMELDGCEILINEMNRDSCDLVVSDAYTVTNGVKRINRVFAEDFVKRDHEFIRKYQCACLGYAYNPMPATKYNVSGLGSPWNKLFSRRIIEENNLRFDSYVKGIYDDNLFTLHYLSCASSVSYVAKPAYNYRIVTQSLTQSYKQNTVDISRRIFERIQLFISEQNDSDFFLKPYYMYVIRRLSAELGVYYFSSNNPKPYKEVKSELKKALVSEPYKSALKEVEASKLMPQHKLTYYTARMHWIFGMWATFKIRRKVKKLMKR